MRTSFSFDIAALAVAALVASCASTVGVQLYAAPPPVALAGPALYPETLEVDPRTGRFLVGSFREGAVYEVGSDGALEPRIKDDRLTSILGIVVDPRSNRLLVTNSDLGAGIRHSVQGPRKQAAVGIYDLASGRALHYVDLTPLVPGSDHLINGITLDLHGNAYATDSFAPVIYKIDPAGNASVFLKDDQFKGEGVNLNGIVYDANGFLLVVKKSTGTLYRIPIADPTHFERVDVAASFIGGDGLQRVAADALVLIANKTSGAASNTAFLLRSGDDWKSAKVVASRKLGNVYPTTSAALNGKLYVLSSHLDEWLNANAATRDAVAKQERRAEIQEIGVIAQ